MDNKTKITSSTVITSERLKKLCEKYHEELRTGEKTRYMPQIYIRYVESKGIFGYAEFGDFFFFGDDLYVWKREEKYKEDNQDVIDAVFNENCTRKEYACRFLYAGADTNFVDSNGECIFVGDVLEIRKGENKTHLALGYFPYSEDDNIQYCFVLENHYIALKDYVIRDDIQLTRVGTVFFQLDIQADTEEMNNKVRLFNGLHDTTEEHNEKVFMAKYTPNFDQEPWKYHGLEELGIEFSHGIKINKKTMERKDYIATIQELLKGRNEEFDKADVKRIRLIRHKDSRKEKIIGGKSYESSLYDLYLYENDAFITYQSEQLVKRFKDVDYIVSFIGEESTSSRFVGVYKNNGIAQMLPDYNGEVHAKFDIQEIEGFELLKERVIIDWNNPVQWLQHYNEMPVIRIDRGMMENNLPVFTKYEDVVLDYIQLKTIIDSNNAEWKLRLESCNCIYLILDKKTGKQYVGSTYNTRGIWGRWSEYAKTGHGGDVELKKCVESEPNYAEKYFQWCILETLPIRILEDQAIERESLYKRKLGTRIHGNNKN